MLRSSESTDVLHAVSVDRYMELPGYGCVVTYTADWHTLVATQLCASLAIRLHELMSAWLDCYACSVMVSSCVQVSSDVGSSSFMPAHCLDSSLSLHQRHHQDTTGA